jgi:hypothetical protein
MIWMILRTERRGTNLVSIFVNRERLDDKKSAKLLDRVLFGDLVFDGNALGGDLKGLGERWTEEKCDTLGVFGQHVLIHLENSVRDVNGRCRDGHRGSSLRSLGLFALALCWNGSGIISDGGVAWGLFAFALELAGSPGLASVWHITLVEFLEETRFQCRRVEERIKVTVLGSGREDSRSECGKEKARSVVD